jgi:hypothetical protein
MVKHFMIKNNIPIPPDIPPSEVSSEKPFSEPPSPCPEPRELHVTSILSLTPTELRKLVENLIDEPAFAESTKKASDDTQRLPPETHESLNKFSGNQATQKHPDPRDGPLLTPEVKDWYGKGNMQYPGRQQNEPLNNNRTCENRGNTRDNRTHDPRDNYDQNLEHNNYNRNPGYNNNYNRDLGRNNYNQKATGYDNYDRNPDYDDHNPNTRYGNHN